MTTAGSVVAPFEFATATRIVFGAGKLKEAGQLTRDLGRRALVVTGNHPERASNLRSLLDASGVWSETFPVAGEPTTLHVAAGIARARLKGVDVILGFGGGSAIDAAKAIAGLLTNELDLFDYLEVIGRGQPLSKPAAPWIAIPTTSGAGAEVTRNAVITSREHRVKASLRSPHLLARVALVDPELTLDLPPTLTTTTGLDALTQLIEPLLSNRANPLVDALCIEGLQRVARSLRIATTQGSNLAARTDMALAALLGGMALANAGLGAVHGLAAPIGGSHPAPHGAVCAALLPHAMSLNLKALRDRAPSSPILPRFSRIAQELSGNPAATPEQGVDWILRLTRDLGTPSLRTLGVPRESFPDLVQKAALASSMKANPIPLLPAEILSLLESAW